jgi:hypothetical protein
MCIVVFYPPLRYLEETRASVARILTPLSGGPPYCEVGHAMPFQGGMKANMALGDAHPYLAPF